MDLPAFNHRSGDVSVEEFTKDRCRLDAEKKKQEMSLDTVLTRCAHKI